MGSIGRTGGLYLIWLCMICACQSAASPTLAERCERAADARQADTADLCLPVYELTRDPAAGARAARALQSRDGALPIVEWIANGIGDSAAGADAWLATGVSRVANHDDPRGLAAFERAVAMRRAGDTLGQLHDAVGLLFYYLRQIDYQAAARQAVIVYSLVGLVDRREDRAAAYINIASLMLRIGNRSITEQIVNEARCFIPVTSRHYARLRQLESFIERAHDHPKLEMLALRVAHAFAIRDGDRALEWGTRFNLIDAAIRSGELDDAEAWFRFMALSSGATANDRAIVAYYRGSLALARGNPVAAVQLVERAIPEAPDSWIDELEDVHGQALARVGRRDPAEQALVRAVRAVERQRDSLENDTFRSWLLGDKRVAFEDLFLLYVSSGRLEDALDVVERATARSTLDGLLAAEHPYPSTAHAIADAGAWSEGMRKLAHALRASHAMAAPPVASIIARLHGNHVITYFRARGDLWAISIAQDGSLRAQIIGNVARLALRVAAWRRNPDQIAAAEQLGTLLLPDAIMPPAGVPVFLVVEDPIADVPFAALRIHGKLVLDQHAVAYAPSAAVLSNTRRPSSALRSIVLGDPMGNLPHARQEATEVARRLRVAPRLGADATVAAVLHAGDATVIHIAAHTAPTPTGAALQLHDGLLDAGAVLDHGVAAGAIVLLTCSSAPITSRDELAPLASAFIAAGAHTVVASRWAVSDDVALSFARRFYQSNGLVDPVRAVATAQQELVQQHVPVEQWSTFAVVGGLP